MNPDQFTISYCSEYDKYYGTVDSDGYTEKCRISDSDSSKYIGTIGRDVFIMCRDTIGLNFALLMKNNKILLRLPFDAEFTVLKDKIAVALPGSFWIYDTNGKLILDVKCQPAMNLHKMTDRIVADDGNDKVMIISADLKYATYPNTGYIFASSDDRYATFDDSCVQLFNGDGKELWSRRVSLRVGSIACGGAIIGDSILLTDSKEVYRVSRQAFGGMNLPEIGYNSVFPIRTVTNGAYTAISKRNTVVLNDRFERLFTLDNFDRVSIFDNYLCSGSLVFDLYERKDITDGIRGDRKLEFKLLDCKRQMTTTQIRDALARYSNWPPNILSVVAYYL